MKYEEVLEEGRGPRVPGSKGPGGRILISLEKMAGIESYVPDRVHTYSTRSGTQI